MMKKLFATAIIALLMGCATTQTPDNATNTAQSDDDWTDNSSFSNDDNEGM